jgi:hypothetical protein
MMEINVPAGESIEAAQGAEPFPIKVVGYQRDKKGAVKEQEFVFMASADYPLGNFVDFLQSIGSGSGGARLYEFITACLVDDEERLKFSEMVHRPGLRLNPDLLDLLSNALVEAYTERPTRLPAASAGGPSPAKRRSRAASNGKA